VWCLTWTKFDRIGLDFNFAVTVAEIFALAAVKKVCTQFSTVASRRMARKSDKQKVPVDKPIEQAIKESEKEPEEDDTESLEIEDEEDEDGDEEEEENEEDQGEEDGVPLSDIDLDAEEGDNIDLVPYLKLHKDNHAALTQALSTFALPLSNLPFHVHQSVTASESVTIDVSDDLSRELAFYKQALDAAQKARKQLLTEGIPFSRPPDYFAEMIKDDEHMDKVVQFNYN
jgi:rRNA-processing protein EBP2